MTTRDGGPAGLSSRNVEGDGDKLIKAARETLRVSEHICDVTMRVWGYDSTHR